MKTSNKILLAVIVCLFAGIVIVAVIVRGSVSHGVGIASLVAGDTEDHSVLVGDNIVTKSFDLNGFTQVTLNNAIDHVTIKSGPKQSIKVTADRSIFSSIGVNLEDKNLIVNVTAWLDWRRDKRVDIVITTNTPLTKLIIHGASNVNYFDIDTNSFALETHGTSSCQLSGKVNSFSLDASGANRVNAEKLIANDVDITASGATNVKVNAKNNLKIDASGASHIEYYGNPKNVQRSNISGFVAISAMGH